jgi:hypothetical protein
MSPCNEIVRLGPQKGEYPKTQGLKIVSVEASAVLGGKGS